MYFLQSGQFVAREDFMREAFADWVENELQLAELASMLRQRLAQKSGLRDFFLPIETANGYLTTAELQTLNTQLQKYDRMTSLEAKKLCADQYMHQKQYVRAIQAYHRLLADTDSVAKEGAVAGDIWSNLGCAYARLYDFSEAVECFSRGYVLNQRLETLQQATAAAYLSEKPELLERLRTRFSENTKEIEAARLKTEAGCMQMKTAHASFSDGQLLQWIEVYRNQCEG